MLPLCGSLPANPMKPSCSTEQGGKFVISMPVTQTLLPLSTSSVGSGVPIENQHVKGGLLYGVLLYVIICIKCYKNSYHAVKSR